MRSRVCGPVSCALALLLGAPVLQAQTLKPGSPYTIVSRDGRRLVQSVVSGDQDMLRIEDLAAAFQLTVREDRSNNALTVTRGGKTVVLSLDQALASIGGRLVSLAAPPARDGGRWVVPADFVSRALSIISDTRIELRRQSRLIVVGEVRVPRVVAHVEQVGSSTRVTLDLSPGALYTVSQEPRRLIVKFDVDALDPAASWIAGQGLVDSVSLADPTTIVVSLTPGFGSVRPSTVPLDAGASRVVLDVLAPGAPAPVVPPPIPVVPPGAARPEPPPALGPPQPPSIRTIVLDPGHGGEEVGARGINGALEKDITLDVSRKLKAAIEAKMGIRVLLTRDDDRLVPLDDRASIANNNKADLLISIHVNASPRRDARGAEVFYLSLDGLSAETRRMAASPTTGASTPAGGGSRDIELILWETAQTRHLTESAVLAGFIEEELRRSIEMSQRALQQASFRVLVGANMPAVLVEIGFVSNPEQEAQLITDGYKDRVVQALYNAIIRYRARLTGTTQERR